MGSAKGCKLWLWDSGSSVWREVTKLINLQWQLVANVVPTFSCTAVITDSATQALVTGANIFRITNENSTDGKCAYWHFGHPTTGGFATDSSNESGAASDSWEIMTGRLSDPILDQKSQSGGTPRLFFLSGEGFMGRLAHYRYTGDRTITGTAAAIISTDTNSIVANVGASNLIAGLVDTGPTLSMRLRKDNVLGLLLDIAKCGDTTNNYMGILEVTHNNSFVPVLSYFPANSTIYESGDPIGADEVRILDDTSELRTFEIHRERDRIANNVYVRYAGLGTGVAQAETSVSADTTFGEPRYKIIYAPLLQDSTSADTLRNTVVNMFKGTANGLIRTEAIAKEGRIFTNAFDGGAAGDHMVIGDRVSIKRDGSRVSVNDAQAEKLLGFAYSQTLEELKLMFGLPRLPFYDDFGSVRRSVDQLLAGVSVPYESKSMGEIATTTLTPDGTNSARATKDFTTNVATADIQFLIVRYTFKATANDSDYLYYLAVSDQDTFSLTNAILLRQQWVASFDSYNVADGSGIFPNENTIEDVIVIPGTLLSGITTIKSAGFAVGTTAGASRSVDVYADFYYIPRF